MAEIISPVSVLLLSLGRKWAEHHALTFYGLVTNQLTDWLNRPWTLLYFHFRCSVERASFLSTCFLCSVLRKHIPKSVLDSVLCLPRQQKAHGADLWALRLKQLKQTPVPTIEENDRPLFLLSCSQLEAALWCLATQLHRCDQCLLQVALHLQGGIPLVDTPLPGLEK